MRVIGTAGHVDHGKSTLIRALTGIDPDRLREEQERGMTIDLGFAWLKLPSGQEVSIVDVPGHERFIKNMLAGVGGIDIALLVIAADEGVMPQTREHLAILDLLAIEVGIVVLTKRDLVDQDWLDLVTAEVEETMQPTTLHGAPIIPVSSTTGEGLDELLAALDQKLTAERSRRQTGWPRLPIDRVFTMSGFGTVLTGTLIDGELRVGQEVEIVPSRRRARVRGLQSHRKRLEVASAGTRVAVNLSGLATDDVERGEVITAPGWLDPTRVIDVRLRIVDDAPRPLAHNAQVTFHTGAAEAMGRASLLDAQELKPGESGWAQVRLDRPLAAARGDLFIVRLPSPSVTIGGGMIVDDHPKRHRRFQERILGQLEVMQRGSPSEVILQALQSKEPAQAGELARRSGQTLSEIEGIVAQLLEAGSAVAVAQGSARLASTTLLISAVGWQRLTATVESTLDRYHAQHHLRRGMPREELRRQLDYDPRTYTQVERELFARGTAAEDGPTLRLSTHEIVLSEAEAASAGQLLATLAEAGLAAPSRGDVQTRFGISDELLQVILDQGEVIDVGPDLLYARAEYERIVNEVRTLFEQEGKLTVAALRDAFGTTRKYALAILEHLDERGVTRRVGDERFLTAG